MLEHLQTNSVALDDNDVSELMKKLYAPWDLNKNPGTKFAYDVKIEKKLQKKAIGTQPLVWLALAKSAFLANGKYEFAICAFKSKSATDQMFANFCPFVIAEYSRHYKNDKTKAKQGVLASPTTPLNRDSLQRRPMKQKWLWHSARLCRMCKP